MAATREICKCCGEVNRVGFFVPDAVWFASSPSRWAEDVLCLACFTRFADEAGIAWDEEIEFFPVSYLTHHADNGEFQKGTLRQQRRDETAN